MLIELNCAGVKHFERSCDCGWLSAVIGGIGRWISCTCREHCRWVTPENCGGHLTHRVADYFIFFFCSFIQFPFLFRRMRVKMTTDNEVNVEEKPRHPDRTRDLFGVQLEVSTQHIVPDSTARWQWPNFFLKTVRWRWLIGWSSLPSPLTGYGTLICIALSVHTHANEKYANEGRIGVVAKWRAVNARTSVAFPFRHVFSSCGVEDTWCLCWFVGQVTSLLLESERRKLSVLQRDLRGALNTEAGSLKAKERQQHELILAISSVSSHSNEWNSNSND